MTTIKKRDADAADIAAAKKPFKMRLKTVFPLILDGLKSFDDEFFSYQPAVFPANDCYALMEKLKKEHHFKQNTVNVFGIKNVPRKEALLGKVAGVRYHYAGNYMTTEAWGEELDKMCDMLSKKYGVELNSCLANWYRDGHDCVGNHEDDEDDMKSDIVVTVSLGTARFFRIFEKPSGKKVLQINLRNGSVHVQKHGMQKVRKHGIPPQTTITGERISLTFRCLK